MLRRIPEVLRNLSPEQRLEILRTRLFLDIQTLPLVASYEQLPTALKAMWTRKSQQFGGQNAEDFAQLWVEKAGLYAEFSRIIAIGVGYLFGNANAELKLRCTVLHQETEKSLLEELLHIMASKRFNIPALALVAHNGRDFDFPFLCRRLLLNDLPIPFALDRKARKPYELQLEDTMDMWRFGERRSFISLRALALLFGLTDGFEVPDFAQLQQAYFADGTIEPFLTTAREDVLLTTQVYLRMQGLESLSHDRIELK